MPQFVLPRRGVLLLSASLALPGCGARHVWHMTDVSGTLAPLQFQMTRASDGRPVTAADYRGKVVLLYFGYTWCPDVCPTTLAGLAQVLKSLGPNADKVAMLFVTVDPNRDTLGALKTYVASFAPQIDGLRGTPDQLASAAKRYRVAYSVTPETATTPYTVTHSNAVFVFDPTGKGRLVTTSVMDTDGIASDIKELIAGD